MSPELRRVGVALLWLAGACWLQTPAQAATRDYALDPLHTRIEFDVDHLGFARAGGRFPTFEGRLAIDAQALERSHVEVTVDVAALDLGDATWERRVLGRLFFDAERYPHMRFRSTRIEMHDARRGVLHGELELRGTVRPLELDFTFNRHAVDKYTFRDTFGFSATGTLDRRLFGMTRLDPEVGTSVQLRIEVQAYKVRGKNSQPATRVR